MNKLSFLFLIIVVAFSSEAFSKAPKPFRKLTVSEKEAIRKNSKLVDRKDDKYYVLVMTPEGDMVIKLYNETPLHRDNFVKKVAEGFYDSLLFHRVINQFMIQGGDPESKKAVAGQRIGGGSAPGDRIPAEFKTDQGIFHKRGVLAAARDGNPEKASSNCQFYIVQRKPWRKGELDSAAVQRRLSLSQAQKDIYTSVGGTPHLDGGYTVFGEMISGYETLDRIAATKTDRSDRPVQDLRMRIFILHEPKKIKKAI